MINCEIKSVRLQIESFKIWLEDRFKFVGLRKEPFFFLHVLKGNNLDGFGLGLIYVFYQRVFKRIKLLYILGDNSCLQSKMWKRNQNFCHKYQEKLILFSSINAPVFSKILYIQNYLHFATQSLLNLIPWPAPILYILNQQGMRLLTHNFIICNVAKCDKNNFPLTIQVEKSVCRET